MISARRGPLRPLGVSEMCQYRAKRRLMSGGESARARRRHLRCATSPASAPTTNEAFGVLLRFGFSSRHFAFAQSCPRSPPMFPRRCCRADGDPATRGLILQSASWRARSEQLELALTSVCAVSIAFASSRQHLVDVVELARQIAQTIFPRPQSRGRYRASDRSSSSVRSVSRCPARPSDRRAWSGRDDRARLHNRRDRRRCCRGRCAPRCDRGPSGARDAASRSLSHHYPGDVPHSRCTRSLPRRQGLLCRDLEDCLDPRSGLRGKARGPICSITRRRPGIRAPACAGSF